MKVEFSIQVKIDAPEIQTKEDALKVVSTLVGDINEYFSDDITDITLLNHTLVFHG